jgi:hydroxypyruvate isomerase
VKSRFSDDVYHAQVMEGDLANGLQVAMSIRV